MPGSTPSSETDEPDSRRVILIVDDEPTVRAMVNASITANGDRYRVVEAATGRRVAQAAVGQGDPCL